MIGQPTFDIADYGHLKVRRAIQRDDWLSEKIYDLAAADRKEWDTNSWAVLEKELENCELKIKDWIVLYT